mmetsp:Transcript_8598/g.18508  ORF Transcript_8598/g.18508 Transcript_8598/m.18508 type:complete len:103 (+) Transcript_8598:851-1159(+)
MQPQEKARIFAEASILRQYLAADDDQRYFERGSNGLIKKRATKHNPKSLRSLQFAWGTNLSYLNDLEKVAKKRSKDRGIGGLVFFYPTDDVCESLDASGPRV